jgi:hypothetical protein
LITCYDVDFYREMCTPSPDTYTAPSTPSEETTKCGSADSGTAAVAAGDTSADTSITELSGATTATTDVAHCVKMHFATDSAVLGYSGGGCNGSVLVQDSDESSDAVLELLCSTYTAVSTADIVAPLLATNLLEQPTCNGVTDDDGADGDGVVRADCTAVTTSIGAAATGGVPQPIYGMAGTATTEERWEVPLRAALFLPADC